jgi:hypothetical protein
LATLQEAYALVLPGYWEDQDQQFFEFFNLSWPVCLMAYISANGYPSFLPESLFRIVVWIHIILGLSSLLFTNPACFSWLTYSWIWCVNFLQFGLTHKYLSLIFTFDIFGWGEVGWI